MDLKRDLETRHDRLNSTNSDQRPLFEKYEFFNPGLSSFYFPSLSLCGAGLRGSLGQG